MWDNNYRQRAFQVAESEIARQLNVDKKGNSARNKVIDLSKTVEDRYTVPVQINNKSPSSALSLAPFTLSNIHLIFVAEK